MSEVRNMRILLYEFITGGGWYAIDPHEPPSGSLLTEGTAMRDTLAADLIRAGARVTLPVDARIDGTEIEHCSVGSSAELSRLLDTASTFDATVVIAPEFDGHLLRVARAVEATGGRLASPSSKFVEIATSKHATAVRLAAAGIRVPLGCLVSTAEELASAIGAITFPAILKPNDGAGSSEIRRLESAGEIDLDLDGSSSWRLEQHALGQAASVAVLCGKSPVVCPAMFQRLSEDGSFAYLGGRRITDPALAERAQQLAMAAVAAFPPMVGYVGVDLILGSAADGSQDTVIEINPRLTTSYVGLRHLTDANLAEAMLLAASGRQAPLSWHERAIEFDSSGAVRDT